MRLTSLAFCTAIISIAAFPQNSPGSQNGSGAAAEWNTRDSLAAMVGRLQEVKPILDQLRPQEWTEKGAPAAYIQQLESTKTELEGVDWALGNLSGKPERLTFAVDAYFRVMSFRAKVASMAEAVRRYQNPAIAELMEAYITESSASQIQLQTYLQELSALKEAELDVMAQEAQRCRVQQIQRRPNRK